jgi:hypothetical protein
MPSTSSHRTSPLEGEDLVLRAEVIDLAAHDLGFNASVMRRLDT